MLNRVRGNLRSGVERIRWFSSVLAERLKIEITIIKMLHQADGMERRREELLKKVGERVCELKEHAEKNILRDKTVGDTIGEIQKIQREIEELRQKLSEISRVGA